MDAHFEETVRDMRAKIHALEEMVDSMLDSARRSGRDATAGSEGADGGDDGSRGPNDDGFYCDTYI